MLLIVDITANVNLFLSIYYISVLLYVLKIAKLDNTDAIESLNKQF